MTIIINGMEINPSDFGFDVEDEKTMDFLNGNITAYEYLED